MDKTNNQVSDSVMLDWIQRDPSTRLPMVVYAWVKCEGGYTLRGTIQYLMEKYK